MISSYYGRDEQTGRWVLREFVSSPDGVFSIPPVDFDSEEELLSWFDFFIRPLGGRLEQSS